MKKKTFSTFSFLFIFFFFTLVLLRLIFLIFINGNYYQKKLMEKTEIYVYGTSAPRGRILDTSGNVIVDNIGVKAIYYHKLANITLKEEISIAYQLANILSMIECPNEKQLKQFWMLLYPKETENLITSKEKEQLKQRKITSEDIKKLKLARIKPEMLAKLTPLDQKAALIYTYMNKDYAYKQKLIMKNVSEDQYAKVIEANIAGITGEMSWERTYPQPEVLASILGSIGKITEEEKEDYLKKDYSLDDTIGSSYLEKQYETFLKGVKAKYKVAKDNTLELVSEAEKGNDLVLSIDLKVQVKLEEILKEKITAAKKEKNTEYYKESYAVVSNPLTGAIVAISGKRLINKDTWQDVTANIINKSYTMGSVVKGASMTVGYQNKVIDIGTKVKDACVKLYLVPQKCSFKSLGVVDDTTALMNSSNYYQFLIAIGLTGQKYSYNMKLNVNKKHFQIYRDTFASYGLGTLTKIDLPNEENGIIGEHVAADLLLNLAIGQYDTYTPIQLVQYINTIASKGKKYAPTLMQKIVKNEEIIKENKPSLISTVNLEEKYLDRIRMGLNLVVTKGTGRGYIDIKYNPAGKTGTSESLLDADANGVSEVKTITTVFAGFVPFDNPRYSIVILSPHISHYSNKQSYISRVNRRISKDITDFLFEN